MPLCMEKYIIVLSNKNMVLATVAVDVVQISVFQPLYAGQQLSSCTAD